MILLLMFKSKDIRLYLQVMKSGGMNIKMIITLLMVVTVLSACGTVKRGTIPWEEDHNTHTEADPEKPVTNISVDKVRNEEKVDDEIKERQEFLQLAYKDWKGVPYLLGGSGYGGIDCSAFMQVVFEDYFSRKIPRTTKKQMGFGRSVRKSQLQTGDMVFFKTGARTYHVGVMINQKEFLHASTTVGVTISDIERDFWKDTYLSARRIL